MYRKGCHSLKEQTYLECKHVKKSFNGIEATKDMNLKLYNSKVVGLIGPNGAGKTTAFNLITGHITPDSGSITWKGEDITGLPPYKIARMGVTRTWQDLRLFMGMTVEENLLIACQDQPGENLFTSLFNPRLTRKKEDLNKEKVIQVLKEIGLEKKASELATDLSYAEQKLLSLGRGLIANSECLLLDEPMSGMDEVTLIKTKSLVKKLAQEQNKAVCIIEHNVDFIAETCDQVFFLDRGQVIAEGKPEEIMENEELTNIYFGT
jgi:branched-chain amino acid transport system permease protein